MECKKYLGTNRSLKKVCKAINKTPENYKINSGRIILELPEFLRNENEDLMKKSVV